MSESPSPRNHRPHQGERAGASRFPLLDPLVLSGDQRALYEAITGPPRDTGPFLVVDGDGHLAGPFNALLYAPALGGPVEALGAALRFGGTLAARTRELVICAAAAEMESDYELYAHSRAAAAAGITSLELGHLTSGRTPPGLTAPEQAALALAWALLRGTTVSAEVHSGALRHFGHAGVAELAILVGYYRLLAGLLAAGATEAPSPGQEPPAAPTAVSGALRPPASTYIKGDSS